MRGGLGFNPPARLFILLLILTGGIFVLDYVTPRGMVEAVLYLVPILASTRSFEERGVLGLTAVCSGLIVLGAFLSPAGVPLWMSVVNRGMITGALWAVAVFWVARMQGEKALRKSQLRYSLHVQRTPLGVIEWDGDFRVVEWNPAAEKIFGYRPEEALGRHPADFMLPESARAHVDKVWNGLLKQEGGLRSTNENTTKDGRVILCDWYNTPLVDEERNTVGVSSIVHDITEQVQAEQALRQSEQRLALVLDATSEGVWDWNINTGEVYHSQRWKEALGYAPEEVPPLISFWEELVHPDDKPRVEELLRAHLEGHRPTYESEYRLRAKSGEWRWILGRGKVVEWDKDGKPLRMVGTDADITERRKLELQFLQAQRMEAVGRLAGGVAHDFNNLLNVILGYSDLLLEKTGLDDSVRQHTEEIRKAGERAVALTRQLLAFSRKQVLQPRVLNLNTVVTDMEKMLRRLIGEDIELCCVLAPALGRVKADATHVQQILMNLAVNARDAMADGGKLTIETRNVELDEDYARRHLAGEPGSYVMLAVSDTGRGMDKETQEHIFEPFFTTKGKEKGTGLGLSTVYGIIKQSQGYIWVYSEPGKGATFKIYLPQVEEGVEAGVLPEPIVEVHEAREEPRTVLVAEDETSLRSLLCQMLELLGYRVLEAVDSSEAIRLAKEHSGTIDLLLTDVVMPSMSGPQLAEHVTALRPQATVLYMSGYTDDAIVRHGVLKSGTHFLEKPFTKEKLAQKLREVFGLRRGH